MNIIYTTIVGSKMHGLDTPDSDEDIRHITLPSLRDIVSPFKNDQIKVKDGKGDDVESWDLGHFCRHLSKGNPTMYEVIKSPLYTQSEYSDRVRSLMPFCFDANMIKNAHCGYADAQIQRYLIPAKEDLGNEPGFLATKLNTIWESNRIKRIPKAVVAAYRVLAQAEQLLTTFDFQPIVKNYSEDLHNKLMSIKLMNADDIDGYFIHNHLQEIENGIKSLKLLYDNLPKEIQDKKADTQSIEDILCDIYGVE